jgi:hypothetical protein
MIDLFRLGGANSKPLTKFVTGRTKNENSHFPTGFRFLPRFLGPLKLSIKLVLNHFYEFYVLRGLIFAGLIATTGITNESFLR